MDHLIFLLNFRISCENFMSPMHVPCSLPRSVKPCLDQGLSSPSLSCKILFIITIILRLPSVHSHRVQVHSLGFIAAGPLHKLLQLKDQGGRIHWLWLFKCCKVEFDRLGIRAYGSQRAAGAFSGFGGRGGNSPKPPELFTQMRIKKDRLCMESPTGCGATIGYP